MAISLYFGLPGCGKTTLLTQMAVHESYLIKMGQSRYTKVITNVPLKCENVFYCEDFSWFGSRYVEGALYLIDEATLIFDSRDYKIFTKGLVKGFVLHRHTRNDIVVFVQIWDRVDKTIRDICDRVYYLHKGAICKPITYINHIPYSILFPDDKSDKYGDIIMGYKKCGFFKRLTSKRIYRKYFYGYFDTYWLPSDMEPLSDSYLTDLSARDGHHIPPSALDKLLTSRRSSK